MAQRRGGAQPIELTGQRFGRLTVAGRGPYSGGPATWCCVCDCGERRVVPGAYLRSLHTQSCGCLNRDRCATTAAKALDREHVTSRFWQFVDKNGPTPAHVPHLGPCWVWVGAKKPAGYGVFSERKRARPAHRVAWFLTAGNWPKLFVLHKCDGGPLGCVRPDHLFLGTHEDNMADMVSKGRSRNCGKAGHGRGRATWRFQKGNSNVCA